MEKILVVDDDEELRHYLVELLKGYGYESHSASNGREALEKASAAYFDVVLLDIMMPGMNGMDALVEFRRISPKSKIIMITGFGTTENAVEAIKKGASDYITKPFKTDELLVAIRRVFEETRFEKETKNPDLDYLLSALANPLRRKIIQTLYACNGIRLMDLSRELKIEDHTKVVFHLKTLKESGIIKQDERKQYFVTDQGGKTVDCLNIIRGCLVN